MENGALPEERLHVPEIRTAFQTVNKVVLEAALSPSRTLGFTTERENLERMMPATLQMPDALEETLQTDLPDFPRNPGYVEAVLHETPEKPALLPLENPRIRVGQEPDSDDGGRLIDCIPGLHECHQP